MLKEQTEEEGEKKENLKDIRDRNRNVIDHLFTAYCNIYCSIGMVLFYIIMSFNHNDNPIM